MHFHLTQQQRIELSLLRRLGSSQRATALVLGVSPSTICRELKRNTRPGKRYHAASARVLVVTRRLVANQHLRKLFGNPALERYVKAKLALQWSPEQIAGCLKHEGSRFRICAQTIYDWIYRFQTDLKIHLRSQKTAVPSNQGQYAQAPAT